MRIPYSLQTYIAIESILKLPGHKFLGMLLLGVVSSLENQLKPCHSEFLHFEGFTIRGLTEL